MRFKLFFRVLSIDRISDPIEYMNVRLEGFAYVTCFIILRMLGSTVSYMLN